MRLPVLLLALVPALALGCRREPEPPKPAAARPPGKIDSRWVTVYDPALASNGYTLTLHEARIPVLLDMNGRPVHSWPRARLKSRVRLLPDGSILGIGLGRQVVEYDWEGRQTWEFRTPDAIPHHDVLRLGNGNTLVLVLREGEGADTLLEVDRAGEVVWTWKAAEKLGDLIPRSPSHPNDVTHVNSLQELPHNPWFAAGDRRFRPGNLLLSARNLDTIFLIDKESGEVVWHWKEDLDRQHEALMNGPGLPGPGLVQLFNNRSRSFGSDRQSEVLEIDPRDGAVRWRYRSPGFFSPTGGLQQALPNGNVLITSTRGGRVFEVTREGQLAWEWVPPYEPVRAVRVAPDASPQLARLTRPAQKAVTPPTGYRHVDLDAYRFARQGARTKVVVEGEARTVLKEENECRALLLPIGATVRVGYGVDRAKLAAAGRADRPPRFTLRLRPASGGQDVVLLEDTVGLDGPAWRGRTVSLASHALEAVQLCVEIDGGATTASRRDRFAFWEQPMVASPRDAARRGGGEDGDLTPEEREVQQKHLKALGYVG